MEQIYKYPRTRHLEGSREQAGDEDLKCVKFTEIQGKYLVLEEKVDGANCGVSFGRDGKMYLQSRGHFLNGGYGERQFDLFKLWAGCFEDRLYRLLGDRYVMYGEWLYAKHTVFYDRLPHYFMEFDIFDKQEKRFFSTRKRREFLSKAPFVQSVRVLAEGNCETLGRIEKWIGESLFISEEPKQSLLAQCRKSKVDFEATVRQTDLTGVMEGIYIKVEDGDYVTDRLKYVRGSFLNTILDSESHWVNRPIVANVLADGVDLFDMQEGAGTDGGKDSGGNP
ncbi:MAG: RNA ligase family protein [Dorea sp.]|nr:RNA ligase family protein [Dorea sp.]